jgi:hypothetical protein
MCLVALLGLGSYAVMGLYFNLIDIGQQLSYLLFLNISLPLNLQDVVEYLYKFNMHIFFPNIFHIIGEQSGSIKVESTPFGYVSHVEDQEAHIKFGFQSISNSFLANSGGAVFFFLIFPWVLMYLSRFAQKRFSARFALWPRSGFWGILNTLLQFLIKIMVRVDFIFGTYFFVLQEMSLFIFLQFYYTSSKDGFNTASMVLCAIFFTYQLGMLFYILFIIWKELPDKKAQQNKFTTLYYIYNVVNMLNLESEKQTDDDNPKNGKKTKYETLDESAELKMKEKLKENQKREAELYAEQTEKYPHLFSPLQRGQLAGRTFALVRYLKKMFISLCIVVFFDRVKNQIIALGSLSVVAYAYMR